MLTAAQKRNGFLSTEPIKAAVLVDQDTDGFTSSVKMQKFLEGEFGFEVIPMICEGKKHGIQDVDIFSEDVELIVIPDAGASQRKELEELARRGYKVIVLDHHDYDVNNLPDTPNVAVVNCKDGTYTNNSLSGVGVVQKFIELYDKVFEGETKMHSEKDLDLVSLGMVADSMHMNNKENMTYLMKGWHPTNDFINFVLEKNSYNASSYLSAKTIGWTVAPFINALIRVGTKEQKEMLYQAMLRGHQLQVPSEKRGAKGEIVSIVEEAYRICTNAKSRQKKAIEKFKLAIENCKVPNCDVDIYLVEPDIHQGVVDTINGLTAMQLADASNKPTLVLRRKGDVYAGSGRNLDHSYIDDLRKFLEDTECFDLVAGHAGAFGAILHKDRVAEVVNIINERCSTMDKTDSRTIWEVDLSDDWWIEQMKEVAEMQDYFVRGFESPIFKVSIPNNMQKLNGKAIRWDLKDGIHLIKFRASHEFESDIAFCTHITATFTMTASEYYGNKQYTANLESVEPCENPVEVIGMGNSQQSAIEAFQF